MFKDVDKSRWDYIPIEAVAKAGLMGGFPDGTFRPDEPPTRGQLASVLYRQMFRDGIFSDILPQVMPSVVTIYAGNKLGSGVCVRRDAGASYILTNRHVAEGTTTYTVTEEVTKASFPAEHYRTSAVPNEDLALIKATVELPPLPLADMPVVQGQPVAVIGSPLGLKESATVGVVSHVSRQEDSWFQLDAPINPGNSGGPIINERGEIVGITVAKVPDAAIPDVGVEGLGYGIKLEIVRRFLNRVWPGEW